VARIPEKRQDEVRKAIHRILCAACLDDARDEVIQFLYRYQIELPFADKTLAKQLEECLPFYRFLKCQLAKMIEG
jgi:transposase-like protein